MRQITLYIITTLLCCSVLTACNGDDKAARAFVQRATTILAAADTDSIAVVYPGAAKVMAKTEGCRIATRRLKTTSFKVKDMGDGVWYATIGDSLRFRFVEGKHQDTFVIKESYGLLDYGHDREAFAAATGWIDPSMNDVKKGKRLANHRFVEWMTADFFANLKKQVKLRKTGRFGDERDGDTWICSDGIILTVTNYNDFALPSDAYEIVCSDWCRTLAADTSVVVVQGEDIPAHGHIKCRVEILTTIESASRQELRYDEAVLLGLLYRNYKATGTEYQRYKQAIGAGRKTKHDKLDKTDSKQKGHKKHKKIREHAAV